MEGIVTIKTTINSITINTLPPPTSSSRPMRIFLPTNANNVIMQQLIYKRLVKLRLRCGHSIDSQYPSTDTHLPFGDINIINIINTATVTSSKSNTPQTEENPTNTHNLILCDHHQGKLVISQDFYTKIPVALNYSPTNTN